MATTERRPGVKIEDVPRWAMDWHGIGHAVACEQAPYVYTACQSWANFSPLATGIPKRICRKCRERLKVAFLKKRVA